MDNRRRQLKNVLREECVCVSVSVCAYVLGCESPFVGQPYHGEVENISNDSSNKNVDKGVCGKTVGVKLLVHTSLRATSAPQSAYIYVFVCIYIYI